jgi:hypothetical protein
MDPDDNESETKDEHRKERVLHTRVPAVLEQELKRLATSLRVPVSNVVRTILEDAVDTLDSVGRAAEGELRHAAERLRRHRGSLRRGREGAEPSPSNETPPSPAGPSAFAPAAGENEPGAGADASAPEHEAAAGPAPSVAEPPPPAAPLAGVIGYQPLLLAKNRDRFAVLLIVPVLAVLVLMFMLVRDAVFVHVLVLFLIRLTHRLAQVLTPVFPSFIQVLHRLLEILEEGTHDL